MIVAVCSFRGVGATTTSLALAAACAGSSPQGTWLIEADPAGGVLAGRIHLAPFAIGGLERVAFPAERGGSVEILHEVAQRLGDISVVTTPADPFRAHACHQPRVPWLPLLRELPGTVVVDAGRVRAGTPAWPLLRSADLVVLVTSAEVSAVVASDAWVQAGGRVSPADAGLEGRACRTVIVDSPGGVAFPRRGLLADLGDGCAGWLPWDPAGVDLLHRGAGISDRRLRKSAFADAAQRLAVELLEDSAFAETDLANAGLTEVVA